jgi:hypothetical protein
VRHGQGVARKPQRDVPLGQPLVAEDPPMHKPRVTQGVEDAVVARLEEGAPEVFGVVADAGVETQHRLRAAAPVFAAIVRPVPLRVVVAHPSVVRVYQFLPISGLREVVVRHLLLDVEGGLDEALPRPALLDLDLVHAQGLVDLPRPVGEEHGARVGYERLRGAVAPDGRVEYREEGGEVLLSADGARENFTAVVLEDGDDVEVALDRQAVLLYVADVGGPDLVAPRGLEGHRFFLVGAPLGFRDAVELPVDSHHPADCPHAYLRAPLLNESGVDAEGAELGVLLRAADEVHGGEVHLAHALRPARGPVL